MKTSWMTDTSAKSLRNSMVYRMLILTYVRAFDEKK